ncbi:hypothetical protein DMS46_07540 [Klebsiella variicola]|nr:hypothetical protein DMS46_07540 [Klebsiella variicola]
MFFLRIASRLWTGGDLPGGTRHHAVLLRHLVVGLLFRLLHLCLKGGNGKSEHSPGKSVARTIRCAFFCYYLECLLSARSSERAFFRLIKALLQTIRHLRAAL